MQLSRWVLTSLAVILQLGHTSAFRHTPLLKKSWRCQALDLSTKTCSYMVAADESSSALAPEARRKPSCSPKSKRVAFKRFILSLFAVLSIPIAPCTAIGDRYEQILNTNAHLAVSKKEITSSGDEPGATVDWLRLSRILSNQRQLQQAQLMRQQANARSRYSYVGQRTVRPSPMTILTKQSGGRSPPERSSEDSSAYFFDFK